MKDQLNQSLNKYYHDYAIAELRLLHSGVSDSQLTYNDILYLSIIDAHSGQYTASNLADMLYVSRPAVTQKINELEKRGYIYKKQSSTDKRVFKLFTDKEGKSKEYYQIVDKTQGDILTTILTKYTKEEIELFCKMSDDMSELLLQETLNK